MKILELYSSWSKFVSRKRVKLSFWWLGVDSYLRYFAQLRGCPKTLSALVRAEMRQVQALVWVH